MIAYIAVYAHTHPDDQIAASITGFAELLTIAGTEALCTALIIREGATPRFNILHERELWSPGAFELVRAP